jgi:hypothetical protein
MAAEEVNDRRDAFLLEMYRQMSTHLNRHILLSWQSVGVVAGALVVFILSDEVEARSDARLDFVVGVVALLCAWCIAHVFDANNWFERNLHIITNIERQFLNAADSREIHYFFTSHRGERSKRRWLIEHLRIQMLMAAVLWTLLLAFHFYQRVYPGLGLSLDHFEWNRSLPYIVSLVTALYCVAIARDRKNDYEKLAKESPGKPLDGRRYP